MGSGQGIGFSFTIDQRVFVLSILVVWGLIGLVAIGFGLLTALPRRDGRPRFLGRRARDHWRRELARWGVIVGDASMSDDATLAEVLLVFARIQGSAVIGAGCGIALFAVAAIALLARSDALLLGGLELGSYPASAGFYSSFVLGFGFGYGVGFARARTRASRGVAYADLRRRQLAGYRSALFRWIPAVFVALFGALTAALAPALGATIPLTLGDTAIAVPVTPWALATLPALMVLVLVAGELLLARITSRSRLLITRDPALAQRADDLLRALAIGTAQAFVLFALGALALAQWDLLAHVIHTGLAEVLLTGAWLAALAVGLSGYGVMILRGRLGGAVTGWPWQHGGLILA